MQISAKLAQRIHSDGFSRTDLFNETVEIAQRKGLLSSEHFSVGGTLIQAWASHKSIRRQDGSEDDRPPEDWRGEPHSNETDPQSKLY